MSSVATQQHLKSLSIELRRGRWRADLSQRELAAAVGVSPAMVARAEVGDPSVSVGVLLRLLSGLGLYVSVVDGDGLPLRPIVQETATDRSGRHYPAHLDVRAVGAWGSWWGDAHWGYVPSRNPLRPTNTYEQRAYRDERRTRALERAAEAAQLGQSADALATPRMRLERPSATTGSEVVADETAAAHVGGSGSEREASAAAQSGDSTSGSQPATAA